MIFRRRTLVVLISIVILGLNTSGQVVKKTNLIHFHIRAFSEGFFQSATNTMLPVADPVNHPDLCDTVLFALIDTLNHQFIYCEKITLDIHGYGNSYLTTNLSGQNVLAYVRFRNTLGVYSRNTFTVDSNYNEINLTDINFASINCEISYGFAKAFSGDMNQDGLIDANDYIPFDIDNINGSYGYLVTDLNGDGFVDVQDYVFFDINNANGALDPYYFNCSLTQVDVLQKENILFYPIPCKNIKDLKIKITSFQAAISNIFVVDLSGKIYILNYETSDNEIRLNEKSSDQLANGIYFVEIIFMSGEKICKRISLE